MTENRNTILAVILSGLVLLGWQYFFNLPQMEKQRAAQQAQSEMAKPAPHADGTTAPAGRGRRRRRPPTRPAANQPRLHGARRQPRYRHCRRRRASRSTAPRLTGSISLKGARIDDLSLVQFRETVDPTSPAIVLYSPSGTASPYYAEFGWVAASGSTVKIPDQNTVWQQEGSGSLTPSTPGDAEI